MAKGVFPVQPRTIVPKQLPISGGGSAATEVSMRRRLLVLTLLLGVSLLGSQRNASAIHTCTASYCPSHGSIECVCPSNSPNGGGIWFCDTWQEDCWGL